jgi:rhamnosyltransferase
MLSGYSVCAVVVTFHPGTDLVANLNLLSRQVEHIVVVDNGSSMEALSLLDSLKEQFRCTILRNGTNLGIAAALNRGCQFAVEHDFAWIVTFDQDSTVTENFIQALLLDAAQVKDLGMISPRYVDRRSNRAIPLPKTSSGRLVTTLTSGSLLQTDTYIKAGPFNESLFIDCVDIEYCLRLRSMERCIAESGNAVLLHSLGKTTFHKMFGRNLPVTNHSPTRRYYMTRNSLYVSFRYPRERSWIRHNTLNTFIDAMKILLFEKQKLAKLRFMIKGVVDCLRGRMGQQVLIS